MASGEVSPLAFARRYGLKNQELTNCLLMLLQLHANRQDDQQVYATDIRACLRANKRPPPSGSPRDHRRPASPHFADQNTQREATGGRRI